VWFVLGHCACIKYWFSGFFFCCVVFALTAAASALSSNGPLHRSLDLLSSLNLFHPLCCFLWTLLFGVRVHESLDLQCSRQAGSKKENFHMRAERQRGQGSEYTRRSKRLLRPAFVEEDVAATGLETVEVCGCHSTVIEIVPRAIVEVAAVGRVMTATQTA